MFDVVGLLALVLLLSACGGKKRDKKEATVPAKTESVGQIHFFHKIKHLDIFSLLCFAFINI